MALGSRVKKRRLSLGITQTELAIAIKATQSYVQSLESRDSKKTNKLTELADALKTSTSYLLTGIDGGVAGENNPTCAAHSKLIELYENATEEGRTAALIVLESHPNARPKPVISTHQDYSKTKKIKPKIRESNS